MPQPTAKMRTAKTKTSVLAFRAKQPRKFNTAEGEKTAYTDLGAAFNTANPNVIAVELHTQPSACIKTDKDGNVLAIVYRFLLTVPDKEKE